MSDSTIDYSPVTGAAVAGDAGVADYLALLKPRVMSLVVYLTHYHAGGDHCGQLIPFLPGEYDESKQGVKGYLEQAA